MIGGNFKNQESLMFQNATSLSTWVGENFENYDADKL